MAIMTAIHDRKMPLRMEPNPLDKATIVSVFPKDIYDFKPMVFPGLFQIPAAKQDDFQVVTIGPSSWFKEMEEGQPFLEITHSAVAMADSFIKDYCAQLGCEMGTKMPGLFYLAGRVSKAEVREKYRDKIELAITKQRGFFENLVKIADVMWARTNGNPLGISDDAKLAATYLGLKDKVWLADFRSMELKPCLSCGELVNYNYPVCKHCKAIINKDLAAKLEIKFAL